MTGDIQRRKRKYAVVTAGMFHGRHGPIRYSGTVQYSTQHGAVPSLLVYRLSHVGVLPFPG